MYFVLISLELSYSKTSSVYILSFPLVFWLVLQPKGSPEPGKHLT